MTSSWYQRINDSFDHPSVARLQLAVFSGVLLGLAFPKFSWGWVAWFALLPLMFLLLQPMNFRSAFLYSLVFGTVFNGIILYWVAPVMQKYGYLPRPLAVIFYIGFAVLHGSFLAVFGVLARKILTQNYLFNRRIRLTGVQIAILNSALVGALWVAVEYWHTYMFTGFPWCLLGYGLVDYVGIMQLSTVTGVYGVSFLLCTFNGLLAHALYQRKRSLFLGIGIALALLLTGDFVFRLWLDRSVPEVTLEADRNNPAVHAVSILQLNIPQDTDWTRPVLDNWLQVLGQMMQDAHTELVVMPENPAPFYYPSDWDFTERLNDMVKRSGHTLIAGVVMSHPDPHGQEGTYNSAATLGPDAHLIAEYDKQHLVPFGEYIPFRKYLFFAGKLTREISDFSPGKEVTVSAINGGKAGIFICYEAIFPDLVRHFTQRGAQILINITNDGWYGRSAAPYQHFEMSRVRAIENRRYLIRAANTGISAIVDPYGRILAQSPLEKQMVLQGAFEYRSDLTFYARFGDLFSWMCIVVSFGFLAGAFANRRSF